MVKNRTARVLVQMAVMLLPWKVRRFVFRRAFGWHLAPTARIGWSMVDVEELSMGEHATIDHFTMILRLRKVEMAERSQIGRYNWVRVAAVFRDATPDVAPGFLKMGRNCVITIRHFIDCSGGLTFEDISGIGGVRSTIFTHQPDWVTQKQVTAGVVFEYGSMAASNCLIRPGTRVPRHAVLAMGTVPGMRVTEPEMIYAGNPARPVMPVGEEYLQRDFYGEYGFVSPDAGQRVGFGEGLSEVGGGTSASSTGDPSDGDTATQQVLAAE